MARSLYMAALVMIVLLVAPRPNAEAQETDEYQQILREALSEYDARNYREARALFARAHEELPNARTLRGIGMASFELREYVESIRRLEEALAHPVRPLTDAQRASVQDLIDRARTFVGRFTVDVEPAGATLYVDGAPADTTEGGVVLLDLGEHELSVRCPGCSGGARRVEVRGGEEEHLTLRAAAGAGSTSAVAGPPSSAEPIGGTDEGGGVSVPGVILLTTAGVLIGGAAASGVWWAGRGSEVERCEGAGAACRNLDSLRGEQTAAGAVTIAAAAAAATAATVGVVLLLSGGDDGDERRSLVCGPTLSGMHCVGMF